MSEAEDIARSLAAAALDPPPPAVPWWKSRTFRLAVGAALGAGVPVLCLEFGRAGWWKVGCAIAQALLPFFGGG